MIRLAFGATGQVRCAIELTADEARALRDHLNMVLGEPAAAKPASSPHPGTAAEAAAAVQRAYFPT